MAQKSVLITGCSSGIGYDAAQTLKARGWRVFAACRKAEDCARLRDEGFEAPRLDYEDTASIAQTVDEVLQATGGTLDAVYNNGAYGIPGLVEDLPTDALRTILEANLIGYHDLTRRLIPVMRAQGHGRIVNCSSVMGYTAYPWRGAYVATKYALEGLTDTLRLELHGEPIHVVLIEPGLITTKFGENGRLQFDKWIDWRASAHADRYESDLMRKWRGKNPHGALEVPASHVTAKLIHALESPRPHPRYKVTRLAHVAKLLTRLLPTRATDWVIRRAS
ncbi:SDR family NAD(P)-dependent oxidoreductase [Psychromarinibacter sp. C21-152]|uniref:SDR family NAD(P)-dependent oxidoreductase n=1 Tax=Psychromarinibacter sediminicola TaxID=3033385 RepID=A0AAE3NRK8_9RHOB|nr:SDR family NAD(P)-dependent oxidoreductase [Psychromarinibacter sediminicola]MDF0600792.1 SDR family NAD(P)-dependent oxidoreductase [Psychromarinibacter sediminicola]